LDAQLEIFKFTDAQLEIFAEKSELAKLAISSYQYGDTRFHFNQELVTVPTAYEDAEPIPIVTLCSTCTSKAKLKPSKANPTVRPPTYCIASGVDIGSYMRLNLPTPSLVLRSILSRYRIYTTVVKIKSVSGVTQLSRLKGHSIAVAQDGPAVASRNLSEALAHSMDSVKFVFIGGKAMMTAAINSGLLQKYAEVNTMDLLLWLAVLTDPTLRSDYQCFVPENMMPVMAHVRGVMTESIASGNPINREQLRAEASLFFDAYRSELSRLQLDDFVKQASITEEDAMQAAGLSKLDEMSTDDTSKASANGDASNFPGNIQHEDICDVDPSVCLVDQSNNPTLTKSERIAEIYKAAFGYVLILFFFY